MPSGERDRAGASRRWRTCTVGPAGEPRPQRGAEVQVGRVDAGAAVHHSSSRAQLAQAGADHHRHVRAVRGRARRRPAPRPTAVAAASRSRGPARRSPAAGRSSISYAAGHPVLRRVEAAQRGQPAAARAERVEDLVDVCRRRWPPRRCRRPTSSPAARPLRGGGRSCAVRSCRPRQHDGVVAAEGEAVVLHHPQPGRRRASLGTQSSPHSGSVSTWLIVGGMKPVQIASAQAIAASALAAPMVWPSIDLIETVRGVRLAEHLAGPRPPRSRRWPGCRCRGRR